MAETRPEDLGRCVLSCRRVPEVARHAGLTPDRRGPLEIRCEWGRAGIAACAAWAEVVIVVDVLSFSTCVDVAVARGAVVFPFPWNDARAADFADSVRAELAGPRESAGYSLSPASFLEAVPGARIVLPSPNGAVLSLEPRGAQVFAGSLRNAAAVARASRTCGERVLVAPAGERWPDDSLRPAIEDWLGAGAIVDALAGRLAPEAEAARAAFRALRDALPQALRECASGRELIGRGFESDVTLAADLNVSGSAPLLRDDEYRRLDETVDSVRSRN